jgi:hypothetical protein
MNIQNNTQIANDNYINSTSWLCRFGWHRWTRWLFDAELQITEYPYGIVSENLKGATYLATRQRRECRYCGKLEYRIAKAR